MQVQDYKWWTPSFAEYNAIQSAVIPFCDKDVNLVVAVPTAAGKTVIAECAFGYHVTNSENCLYLCPFKALASEKIEAWEKTSLAKNGIGIWSGDFTEREEAGLVIGTLEAVDFAVKSGKMDDWVKSLGCLVLDEAHIIGDNRGSVAENILMNVSELNPSCRLILLSATMGNAKEISAWVKSLNGKETKCISSNWRPFKVDYRIYSESTVGGRMDKAVELVEQNRFVKTLLFVHSKKIGSELVKRLRENGIRSVFHNASVKPHLREKMEKEFNDPFSGLDVLVSTGTLGAGVNIG